MAVGVGLFLASSWLSPYLSDMLGIPESLSFLTVGGILAFAGGIVFYSGVRPSTQYF
jgi:hypothetical protein